MTSFGIALGFSFLWGLGIAAFGAYWIKRERSQAELKKRMENRQRELPFAESEYTPLVGPHAMR